MIVDILDRHDSRQVGLGGLFARVAEPLAKRSEPGEQTAAVDETDVQIAEAHDVVAGLVSGEATSATSVLSIGAKVVGLDRARAPWPGRYRAAIRVSRPSSSRHSGSTIGIGLLATKS
jgi:hypothetical protein